jgi:hypothetical protein
MATVTITGDRAANLDLHVCLALTAFGSEGSFTCHTYSDTGPPFFKVISERPAILTSECRAKERSLITIYFKRLRFGAAGPSGTRSHDLGTRTHDLPDAKRDHYHYATATNFTVCKAVWKNKNVMNTNRKRKQIQIDWLFTVLRPAQEFFTCMETSPLSVKGCKI